MRLSKPLTEKTRKTLEERLTALEKPKAIADFKTLTLVLQPYFAEYCANLSDNRLETQVRHMIEYIKHIPLCYIKKVVHNYITGHYGDVIYQPKTAEFINKCNRLQEPICVEIYLIKLVLNGIEPVDMTEQEKQRVMELLKKTTEEIMEKRK